MARILLIEPDRPLAEIYKRTLEDADHEVVPVSGSQAAIIACDRLDFDLVIVELQLVGHSGFEFLYEYRSYPEWHAIPVLIHTHVSPAEFSVSAKVLKEQLGISGYLHKPTTDLRQLRRTVSHLTNPVSA